MRDQYIFDIPIYRIGSDGFNSEVDRAVAKRVEWIVSHDPQRRPLDRETTDRQKHSVIKESGGPWQFNHVVGWLRLFAEGNTVGCHPWWVDAKRLTRKMKRKHLYLTTYSDVLGAYFPSETSIEIHQSLLERLTEMADRSPYKKRFVDLDVFQRTGPYIDWRRMLDEIVQRANAKRRDDAG